MKNLVYNNLLVFSLILISLGLIFKLYHWPDAKILLVIGFGLFEIITPLIFVEKFKNHNSNILKAADIAGLIAVITIPAGLILGVLDISKGFIITKIGVYILILIFAPLVLIVLFRFRENRLKRVLVLLCVLLFPFINIRISRLINLKPLILDMSSMTTVTPEQSITKKMQDNRAVYDSLVKDHPDRDKIILLRKQFDSINTFIQNVKIEIVKSCSENDSMLKVIMFQNNNSRRLKDMIDGQKLFIRQNFSRYIKNDELEELLATKDEEGRFPESWEDEHFNHLPSEGVIAILSGIQNNLANVENQIFMNLKDDKPAIEDK